MEMASAMKRFMDRQLLQQASDAAREKASHYTLQHISSCHARDSETGRGSVGPLIG